MQRYKQKKTNNSSKSRIVSVIILFLILFTFFYFAIFIYKYYSLDKFIFVNRTPNGGAEVIIADTENDEIHKYVFSENFELNVSRNYGVYKLKNIWELGEKHNLNGRLMAETLVKNFNLPVYFWKNNNVSNLSILQKVRYFFLEKGANVTQDNILKKDIPDSVSINFTNDDFIVNTPRISIEDHSGEYGLVDHISKIVDILGGKVVHNSSGEEEDIECELTYKDHKNIYIFSNLFGCSLIEDKNLEFDYKIKVGAKFSDRF